MLNAISADANTKYKLNYEQKYTIMYLQTGMDGREYRVELQIWI